jgi:hypothetical protein
LPAYDEETNVSSPEAVMQWTSAQQNHPTHVSSSTERQSNGPVSGVVRTTDALEQSIWLVWVEGGQAVVGPVSASQVARGIKSGRVPADASIQRAGEVFWTGVLDEPAVIAALKSA